MGTLFLTWPDCKTNTVYRNYFNNVAMCLAGAVDNVADSRSLKPKGAEFNPRWRQGLSLSKKV